MHQCIDVYILASKSTVTYTSRNGLSLLSHKWNYKWTSCRSQSSQARCHTGCKIFLFVFFYLMAFLKFWPGFHPGSFVGKGVLSLVDLESHASTSCQEMLILTKKNTRTSFITFSTFKETEEACK